MISHSSLPPPSVTLVNLLLNMSHYKLDFAPYGTGCLWDRTIGCLPCGMTGGFASEDPVCCMGSLNESWYACTAASLGLECGSGKGPRTQKTRCVDHLTSSFLLLYCKVLHMITYWKTVWHCLHSIVRVGCSS